MFSGIYAEWNQKRIKFIVDHYTPNFFFNRSVLDLGCGHGDISGALQRLGAKVSVIDARNEHLKVVFKKYPGLQIQQADLDRGFPVSNKNFDLVLHMGLLCHLHNFEDQIKAVCKSASHLVLETTVCDSSEDKCVVLKENKGQYDLSVNGVSSRPTSFAIERVLQSCGMSLKRIDSSKLNAGTYKYDWRETNNGECNFYHRRLWVCEKTAPIINSLPSRVEFQPTPISNISSPPIPLQPELPASFTPTLQTPSPKSIHIIEPLQVQTINPNIKTHPDRPVAPNDAVPRHLWKHPHERFSPPPPPTPPDKNALKIRLFFNYYEDPISIRQKEIDEALNKNIANKLLNVIVVSSDECPTFDFLFSKINRLVGDNDISIICHSDIYFDESIKMVSRLHHKEMFALNYWNVIAGTRSSFVGDPYKQAAWIVKGKIENVSGDFAIGKPGAASSIARSFQQAGYNIINPSHTIKAFHLHNSNIFRFTQQDRVPGELIALPPIKLA